MHKSKNLQSIWDFGEEHNAINTNISSLRDLLQLKLIRNNNSQSIAMILVSKFR